MFFRYGAIGLAAATIVHGFRDSSPFVLLSTESAHGSNLRSAQISHAAEIQEQLVPSLADCTASLYIFIEQPGISAGDLRDGSAMPNMRSRVQSEQYKSTVRIPEVIGRLQPEKIATQLSQTCGLELMDLTSYLSGDGRPRSAVLTVSESPLTHPEGSSRASMLQIYDSMLDQRLTSVLANHTSHVVIYTSIPPSEVTDATTGLPAHRVYQMDAPLSDAAMHMDLKRDAGGIHARQAEDPQASLPLFEKYQFLSPAIFMGLAVTVLLLLILNIGISAISGLEISYMAFNKEMGPQAQQKGKQQ